MFTVADEEEEGGFPHTALSVTAPCHLSTEEIERRFGYITSDLISAVSRR